MERKYEDEYNWSEEDTVMDWQQKGFWFLCGVLIALVICAALGLILP